MLARSEMRQRDAELRRGRERLGDDAVPFRQPQQSLDLVIVSIGVKFERYADGAEPDRGVPVHRKRPAEIKSPSTWTEPPRTRRSRLVATARNVTPAQAARACSSMSPEHNDMPSPPLAGCSPATANARPVCTEQVMPSDRAPSAVSVTTAAAGSPR